MVVVTASSPPWRSVLRPAGGAGTLPLALGVELRQREPASSAHWSARRVTTVTTRGLSRDQHELSVGLRPLMRSRSTGTWIRGDASWESLRRGGGAFAPSHRQWFSELFGIARDVRILGGFSDSSDWITLDSVTSSLLWPHLAQAGEIGIPLVSTQKHLAVSLRPDASVRIALSRHDGGLRLSPLVRIGDATVQAATVRPIGGTGIYAFAIEGRSIHLTLAPAALTDTAQRLLRVPERVMIPPDDVDEFFRDAYPLLAREGDIVAVDGLELPEPEPLSVVLTVEFIPQDVIEYRFEWWRPGRARAAFDDPARTLHLASDSADDPVETALHTEIVRSWSAHTDLAFAPSGTLRGTDAAEFGSRVLPALETLEGVRVEVRGTRRRYRELTGEPRITIKTVETTDPDWFDLGILVEIDGRSIPFTPLFTALATRRKKLLLSDGRYFSLAHPALERLRELIDESVDVQEWEAGPRISRYQLPFWSDFEDLADETESARSWRAAAEALSRLDQVESTAPTGLRADLRPYQQEGLDRLALLWRHRLGGILADDMGLGKTLQMLALLAHAREAGERRPFLVVAPTSVLTTWRDEATRFAPDLRVHVVAETSRRSGLEVGKIDADVVVTSYTLLRLEDEQFLGREWGIVVLDEAQFVKNPRTRLHRVAAQLRSDVVFAVTGTPLENRLDELWALLSLTSPGLFASHRRFREEYVKPIEQGKVPENAEDGAYRADRLARLRHRIRPFVLRRTKQLVAPELPPRQEQELRIELAPAHRAVYDTVLQRERQKVLGLLDDLDRHRFIVFRSLTLLRMLALAPSLVDAGDPGIPSSKLDALRERIAELAAEGHRALVFSQFTSYLALVSDALDAGGIRYDYLDGATRARERVIDGFRRGDAPVFLISLKAGGVGLTLTEADYVFLLDPWWNPAAESQAVDRTHRIGQRHPVNVYRMIAAGTIEEKVVALQQRKARLFQAVLDDDELLSRTLTADDVRGLFSP